MFKENDWKTIFNIHFSILLFLFIYVFMLKTDFYYVHGINKIT